MGRIFVVVALSLIVNGMAQAAERRESGASTRKPEVVNRIRSGEPMPGQMKRKGMMKESVREQAMKKDELMRDALKKEAPARK